MITEPAAPAPTRERILDAAVELFGRQGYSGTSVGEIEEAAGLVPRSGALYKHFASKRALLDAAVQRRASVATRASELAKVPLDGDPRAILHELARASLRIVSDDQALLRIVMREGDNFPELRDAFHERIVHRGLATATEWLKLVARRAGTPEFDAEALATVMFGSIINYCVLETLFGHPPRDVSEERFLDAWTDSTLKLLEVNGLVTEDQIKEASA